MSGTPENGYLGVDFAALARHEAAQQDEQDAKERVASFEDCEAVTA